MTARLRRPARRDYRCERVRAPFEPLNFHIKCLAIERLLARPYLLTRDGAVRAVRRHTLERAGSVAEGRWRARRPRI